MVKKLTFPTLSLAQWPDGHQAAWELALTPARFFEGRYSLARTATDQHHAYRRAWGRLLGFAAQFEAIDLVTIQEALDRSLLAAYIEAMTPHLSPVTVRTYVVQLHYAALAMWGPVRTLTLKSVMSSVIATTMPENRRSAIPIDSRTLFECACAAAEEAADLAHPVKRAVATRDALMVALLIAAPVRLRALTAARVDHSLIRQGEHYRLSCPASDTKAGRPTVHHLPQRLTAIIERYIAQDRNVLLTLHGRHARHHDGTGLWISNHASPYRQKSLSERIVDITSKLVGIPICPHRFREIAATSIAVSCPDQVGIIQSVLDHTCHSTSERFYVLAGSARSSERYREALVGLEGD